MSIVEYYEQVVQTMRPLDDELVLLDLGDGRYCAFGERVSSRARYAHEQRYGRVPGIPADYNTVMWTNRPGFDCAFICGEQGLDGLRDGLWRLCLVEPAAAMRPAISRLWESVMTGHPKFKWFVPRAVASGELVQLRLF